MNYQDKLPDLIDGLLEPEEEQLLYSQLADDEMLRQDYKSINTIIQTINSNMNNFAPSQQSTEGVFAALGFSLPASEIEEHKGKIFKMNRFLYTISSIAAAFLLFFIMSNKTDMNNIEQLADFNPIKTIENILTDNSNDKSEIIRNNKGNAYKNNSILNDYSNSSLVNNYNNEILTNTYNIPNTSSSISFNYNFLQFFEESIDEGNDINKTNNTIITKHSSDKPDNSIPRNDVPEALSRYSSSNSFTVEVKNSFYFNPKDGDKNSSRLNNLGLTILYQLDENFSAGIDLRDEPFEVASNQIDYSRQILSSTEANNVKSSKSDKFKNIDYTTIGVAVRYSMNSQGNIYPMGQVVLGKNRDGLVGRVNLGLCFKPLPNFTTTAGIEVSNMNYKNSGASHNATKFGLNYGIAYNF